MTIRQLQAIGNGAILVFPASLHGCFACTPCINHNDYASLACILSATFPGGDRGIIIVVPAIATSPSIAYLMMHAFLMAGVGQSPNKRSRSHISLSEQPNQAYLAICVSVKNQNEDLREWLIYHHRIGAGKFYIMDDNSAIPVAQILNDFIEDGANFQESYTYCSWYIVDPFPSVLSPDSKLMRQLLSAKGIAMLKSESDKKSLSCKMIHVQHTKLARQVTVVIQCCKKSVIDPC